jgi:hypothetical protein
MWSDGDYIQKCIAVYNALGLPSVIWMFNWCQLTSDGSSAIGGTTFVKCEVKILFNRTSIVVAVVVVVVIVVAAAASAADFVQVFQNLCSAYTRNHENVKACV